MPTAPTDRSPSQLVLDRSIGENLDRVITADMRGDGIGRLIYAAARADSPEPLTLAAARRIAGAVSPGDTALLLTGFMIPPSDVPETDGPIGSAVLALALVRACGAVPAFVLEPEAVAVQTAALRTIGLTVAPGVAEARAWGNAVALLEFPRDAADPAVLADELIAAVEPAVVVAVERPGANAQGEYHFAGGHNVSGSIARLDVLLSTLVASGTPSVAVGDFGNELGMGAIADAVKAGTPAGGRCGCGCGGGTANEVVVDVTLACTVSDWGAYAISAVLAHLADDLGAFVDAERYQRVAEAAAEAGAIDGTSRMAITDIDGVPGRYNTRLVQQLRDLVELPRRPFLDNAMRAHRATIDYPVAEAAR